ncbi:MAG: MBL fold metallo-hydrolase, partial [Oscillospiraceae bacterium]|nr:MBL fold metallo-hydrolase [Oscillospiraceae bacterium]
FYDSEPFADFEKYLKKAGAEITVPQAGDRFLLGSAVIDILALNSGEGENDTSIVLNITYGDTKFMFTGDAESAAEDAVANLRKDAKTTVLKVAHHGADTSTSAAFLRAADPAYAVISVGEDNDYGHPTEQVLERLERKGVQLFRTDLQGDVKCTSDGKTVTFSVERNTDINPYVVVTPTTMVTPTPAPQQESYGVDYILNKNTEKFHYPDCDSVKKMKESNKIYFTGTRDEVIMRGYEPCGNCRP